MGEYEPEDSRNITGTASTPDGRWTNKEGKSPSGVPDENPANAKEAAEHKQGGQSDAQPPISDQPNVPEHDKLPGMPRPASGS